MVISVVVVEVVVGSVEEDTLVVFVDEKTDEFEEGVKIVIEWNLEKNNVEVDKEVTSGVAEIVVWLKFDGLMAGTPVIVVVVPEEATLEMLEIRPFPEIVDDIAAGTWLIALLLAA